MTFRTVEQFEAIVAEQAAQIERLRAALENIAAHEADIKRLRAELAEKVARTDVTKPAIFLLVLSAGAILTRAEKMIQAALQSKEREQ